MNLRLPIFTLHIKDGNSSLAAKQKKQQILVISNKFIIFAKNY
jgi:hypothetical protein